MAAGKNLISFAPDECSRHHRLGPGRILAGFGPCACPAARAKGLTGHQWVRCLAWDRDGVLMVWLDPPCWDWPPPPSALPA